MIVLNREGEDVICTDAVECGLLRAVELHTFDQFTHLVRNSVLTHLLQVHKHNAEVDVYRVCGFLLPLRFRNAGEIVTGKVCLEQV